MYVTKGNASATKLCVAYPQFASTKSNKIKRYKLGERGNNFPMKKFAIISLLLLTAFGISLFAGATKPTEAASSYLRIHIRADSNDPAAQSVKLRVRDAVVEYLTPIVANCATKQASLDAIGARLSDIEGVAEGVLRQNGYTYGARARLKKEEFPTRVYDGVTLDAGVYDALILELGTGKGDNWWCVVYPPLCFTGGHANIVYRSKIAEIVARFFGK